MRALNNKGYALLSALLAYAIAGCVPTEEEIELGVAKQGLVTRTLPTLTDAANGIDVHVHPAGTIDSTKLGYLYDTAGSYGLSKLLLESQPKSDTNVTSWSSTSVTDLDDCDTYFDTDTSVVNRVHYICGGGKLNPAMTYQSVYNSLPPNVTVATFKQTARDLLNHAIALGGTTSYAVGFGEIAVMHPCLDTNRFQTQAWYFDGSGVPVTRSYPVALLRNLVDVAAEYDPAVPINVHIDPITTTSWATTGQFPNCTQTGAAPNNPDANSEYFFENIAMFESLLSYANGGTITVDNGVQVTGPSNPVKIVEPSRFAAGRPLAAAG